MGKLSLKAAYEGAAINAWVKSGWVDLETIKHKISASEEIQHLLKGCFPGTVARVLWVVTDRGLHAFVKDRLRVFGGNYKFVPYSQIIGIQTRKEITSHGWIAIITVAFGLNTLQISYISPNDAVEVGKIVNSQISKPKAVTISETKTDESKTCPDCAENVKVQARKCRFCGFLFE
jgi:hypothetical protein